MAMSETNGQTVNIYSTPMIGYCKPHYTMFMILSPPTTTMNTRDEFRNVSVTEAVSVMGAHAAWKADLNWKL